MLTDEQKEIINAVSESDGSKIIAVNAIAGSGKSFTAKCVVDAIKPKNGFYTAFNRAIVHDTQKKMKDSIPCKTMHALAYSNLKPKKEIRDILYTDIEEPISYTEKQKVIDMINGFYNSKYTDIDEYLQTREISELSVLVPKYVQLMLDGVLSPTFDFMLKCLHYDLVNNQYNRPEFDLFIFDECQDIVPVSLEIFKLIPAKRKLMLGDRFQNIYSFMNTVNAFEQLDNTENHRLTQSFRCNEHIADMVESFGKMYLDPDFRYKGTDDISCSSTYNKAYITRTNSSLIETMRQLMLLGCPFSLTRPVKEIFELPLAILTANSGKTVLNRKYSFLGDEYIKWQVIKNTVPDLAQSFLSYLSEKFEHNKAIVSAIAVINRFRNEGQSLYDFKKAVEKMKPDRNVVVSTAHAFKGLEANTVHIGDDLNRYVSNAIEKPDEYSGEELNTYYVAMSRAQTALDNVRY